MSGEDQSQRAGAYGDHERTSVRGQRYLASVRSVPSRRSAVSRMSRLAAIGFAAAVAAGCAQDAPQDIFDPAGTNSQTINNLQVPVFIAAAVVGVIVFIAVGVAVARFRDRGQPIPEQTHGKAALEVVLTVLPAIILTVIAIPTVSTVFALANTDDTECVINVTGQQWWWEYDYPVADDGSICGFAPDAAQALPIVTSQLVIPEGTNVLLRGTSRDVIHSYWVPRLNGKKDMVPGRVHYLRLEGKEPGIYAGQCAEFCGLSHANMRMEVVVLAAADFQAWLDNQLAPYQAPAEGSLAAEGEALFIQQCARCHQVNGLTDPLTGDPVISAPELYVYSGAAPNLTNLMTRSTFAGGTFNLANTACWPEVWEAPSAEFGERYLQGVSPECLNEFDLRGWLRNAPEMKPMYTDPADLGPTDGRVRGMPYLALDEDQIEALIAYLLERK